MPALSGDQLCDQLTAGKGVGVIAAEHPLQAGERLPAYLLGLAIAALQPDSSGKAVDGLKCQRVPAAYNLPLVDEQLAVQLLSFAQSALRRDRPREVLADV